MVTSTIDIARITATTGNIHIMATGLVTDGTVLPSTSRETRCAMVAVTSMEKNTIKDAGPDTRRRYSGYID